MGQPELQKTFEGVSVEGLDGIFEGAPVPEPVTRATAPVPEPVTRAEGLPVEEAAMILGTSANALKKRLRKGTIQGFKVELKHGEKWFVASSELETSVPVPEPVTRATAPVPEPVTRAMAPVPEPVTCAVEVLSQDNLAEGTEVLEHLRDLERKLEAATFRNGYLEAENEGLRSLLGAKEDHIKLLTDSQHKHGWWSRFCSWFIK